MLSIQALLDQLPHLVTQNNFQPCAMATRKYGKPDVPLVVSVIIFGQVIDTKKRYMHTKKSFEHSFDSILFTASVA